MPPKPTCKVVKREGQRGARIDPKGCTVRTEKSAAGTVTTRNKAGETKIKAKERDSKFFLAIAGSTQSGIANGWSTRSAPSKRNYKSNHKILYDTGAQITLMSKDLLTKIGVNWRRNNNMYYSAVMGVGGSENTKVLQDVQFYVLIDSRTSQWTLVTADVYVKDVDSDVSNLLGVDAILQLNRLKVKFV